MFGWQPRKHITCNDGSKLSVQVGESLYCLPREADAEYTHVEVGFLQDKDGKQITPSDDWKEYGDGSFPSDVYGYVPVELVERYIQEHGGRKTWT